MRSLVAGVLVVVLPCVGSGQFQLATPDVLAVYRNMIPAIDDAELQSIVDNPRTIWYTSSEMPKAYQFDSRRDSVMGAHSALHNVAPRAGDPLPDGGGIIRRDFDPFGNGNMEWPWDHPAVLDNSDNRVNNVVGFLLPDELPVVYYEKTYRSRTRGGKSNSFDRRGLGWTFPSGTTFVELISTLIGGNDYTFSIFRMSKENDGGWKRFVYRPFTTKAEYETAIGKSLDLETQVFTLRNRHPVEAFRVTARLSYLPQEPPAVSARALMDTPFRLCSEDDRFIPTTRFKNQIVPDQYLGKFIGNGGTSCLNCHREVGTHVSNIELNRDWYGMFRGNDEIFSWHPFDPICISSNGSHTRMMPRREFTSAGIIEPYNRNKHRPPTYRVDL